MARLIGILILIALGSVVAGILCAFLLYNISQRFQNRRQALFQKNVNLTTTETTKQPVATTVKVGTNKPYDSGLAFLDRFPWHLKSNGLFFNFYSSPSILSVAVS